MKDFMNKASSYIVVISLIVAGTYSIYNKYFKNVRDFIDSNFFAALVTVIVGLLAIYLYILQRTNQKKDAAKLILQEIRRAEEIILGYKDKKEFKFTKKIIATNSWEKNIHYFVDDLDQDELDKVSNLYSVGSYLDTIVGKTSDYQFQKMTQELESEIQRKAQEVLVAQGSAEVSAGTDSISTQKNIAKFNVSIQIETPWSKLFDDIVYAYEPIYHASIGLKLKKLSGTNKLI